MSNIFAYDGRTFYDITTLVEPLFDALVQLSQHDEYTLTSIEEDYIIVQLGQLLGWEPEGFKALEEQLVAYEKEQRHQRLMDTFAEYRHFFYKRERADTINRLIELGKITPEQVADLP